MKGSVKKIPDWIKKVSIDRITIVGDIPKSSQSHIQNLFERASEVNFFKEGQEAKGMLFGKIHWQLLPKFMGSRDFRIEFNPNNLHQKEVDFVQQNILPLLKNVSVTRLDIAFDIDLDMNKYAVIELERKKKLTKIFGMDRLLETLYLGSRSSDKMLRMYDKAKEQKKEIYKSLRQQYPKADKKEMAEMVDAELQVMLDGQKDWWRIEFELKREENTTELLHASSGVNLFDGVKIAKPAWRSAKNLREKSMLFMYQEHPEEFKNADRDTKKKYKKLSAELAEDDITPDLKNAYEQKKGDLNFQISQYVGKAIKSLAF